MKVLYIAAECKPFSKVGGVGDVAGELPPALRGLGVDVEIATPLYGSVASKHVGGRVDSYDFSFNGRQESAAIYGGMNSGVPVSFVRNPTYFEGRYEQPYIYSKAVPFRDDVLRFSFFSRACLELVRKRQPDIVHINDWVLGYLFGLMAMHGLPQARVLTVHNIGYQGNIGCDAIRDWDVMNILGHPATGRFFLDPRPKWKSVNALRLALELADMTNTVSPTYCKEIQKPEKPPAFFAGGKGLEKIARRLARQGKLVGIVNGFEYANEPNEALFEEALRRKAAAREALAASFSEPEGLLLGFVGRAVEQKFRLLTESLDGRPVLAHLLDLPRVNVAILATGLPEYESFIQKAPTWSASARQSPGGNYRYTLAFDSGLAQQISLGSDVFLMPSLFEPCGITQMESLSHATPPLARFTGGLVDTVRPHTSDTGTGFGFSGRSRKTILENLVKTVRAAARIYSKEPERFLRLQRNGFFERFRWSDAAERYVHEVYEPALRAARRG